LSELLLPHAGIGEIRLLAPALVAAQQAGRLVMVFDPPAALSASALARLGIDVDELLIVNTRARVVPGSDSLWALEQALKSGHVGAVLAWLPPRLRAERLRRLQLAAHNHDGAAFVVREASAAGRPTASPLRLALQAGGADRLQVRVLKRRGPPLEVPLQLALPPVLSGAARRRADSQAGREPVALQAATFVNFA
jgi:protein ImuA